MKKDPIELVKRSIRNKSIYQLPEVAYQLKLNQNENPYDLPDNLKSVILEAIKRNNWNRYPELGSSKLRSEIGRWLSIPEKQILVGNGSNEIMLAIMITLLEPGRKLVTIEPTFSLYKHYGDVLGADVVSVPLKQDFAFPVNELIEEGKKHNTALTVLCSPNNPTGNRIAEENLSIILKSASGYVFVDEAYIDFCSQDFSELLGRYSNLILTRTFSKAFAFSMGRFGYGLASQGLVEEVYKVLPPYNLNGMTESAAAILLQYRPQMQPVIDEVIAQRNWLFEKLNEITGITAFPSEANFVLIRPKCGSKFLFEELISKGIMVRDVSYYPGLGNHLRITTGKPEENGKLVAVLKEIMKRKL